MIDTKNCPHFGGEQYFFAPCHSSFLSCARAREWTSPLHLSPNASLIQQQQTSAWIKHCELHVGGARLPLSPALSLTAAFSAVATASIYKRSRSPISALVVRDSEQFHGTLMVWRKVPSEPAETFIKSLVWDQIYARSSKTNLPGVLLRSSFFTFKVYQ